MKIKVLMTGGTIDKVYNTSTGELTFVKTHIIDMLNRSRSMVDTLSEVLFLKDSFKYLTIHSNINTRRLILHTTECKT
jgi:L-asparaginase